MKASIYLTLPVSITMLTSSRGLLPLLEGDVVISVL